MRRFFCSAVLVALAISPSRERTAHACDCSASKGEEVSCVKHDGYCYAVVDGTTVDLPPCCDPDSGGQPGASGGGC